MDITPPIKHLELSHSEWDKIKQQLTEQYGTKILLSWVMRRELNFTIREHHRWDNNTNKGWHDQRSVMCIDFYSEDARTYFLLRFY
jgi:hypothetical protein